jgi:hypothetical protein
MCVFSLPTRLILLAETIEIAEMDEKDPVINCIYFTDYKVLKNLKK